MFSLEQRRLFLHEHYKTLDAFNLLKSIKERGLYYESLYNHLKDGRKHTKQEKITFQKDLNFQADRILFGIKRPIKKVVLVYENKNDQNLKEFVVSMDSNAAKERLASALEYCLDLNHAVISKEEPAREGRNKSDTCCRWCNFKIQCWT